MINFTGVQYCRSHDPRPAVRGRKRPPLKVWQTCPYPTSHPASPTAARAGIMRRPQPCPASHRMSFVEAFVREALIRLNPDIAVQPERADEVLHKLRAIVLGRAQRWAGQRQRGVHGVAARGTLHALWPQPRTCHGAAGRFRGREPEPVYRHHAVHLSRRAGRAPRRSHPAGQRLPAGARRGQDAGAQRGQLGWTARSRCTTTTSASCRNSSPAMSSAWRPRAKTCATGRSTCRWSCGGRGGRKRIYVPGTPQKVLWNTTCRCGVPGT